MSDGGGAFIFLCKEEQKMPETKFESVIFTVVAQVALASILGVYHGYGFTSQFIPNYLTTYCKNFIMALPVQLFIAGPIAQLIFRKFFGRN